MRIKFIDHPDFQVLTPRQALSSIKEEIGEWLVEPTWDEFSDICFGVGRLLGAILKKKYIPVPFDEMHILKCNHRYNEYGHFRSHRHIS